MVQTIPLKEVRNQLSEVINRVAYGRSQVVLTKFGKPKAALISYEDYERIMNPQARFNEKDWEKGFTVFDRVRSKTKGINRERLEKTIREALSQVREERSGSRRR